ncbi:MAG: formimidoylglutamase [Betaproteobacteria bacterium]|nr:formimidoylglutamase [Betaproteobacteria bacterium]
MAASPVATVDRPFDPDGWTGRSDLDSAGDTTRYHQRITPWTGDAETGIGLIGFACDEGVRRNGGRPGAAEGPLAIRRALANLAVHHATPVYDCGDIVCVGDALEAAQLRLAAAVCGIAGRPALPVVLGGGHEVAYGTWLGIADARPGAHLLIVNLDAHFDLRAGGAATSGTPFRQIADECRLRRIPFSYVCLGISRPSNTLALFSRAAALDVEFWRDEELHWQALSSVDDRLQQRIAACDGVYLSIDLDVLPGEKAPGVSAPAARGVSLGIVEHLAATVANSGKLLGADIAELNPELDRDTLTARVAARLVDAIVMAAQVSNPGSAKSGSAKLGSER